jgi:hypothetical protein
MMCRLFTAVDTMISRQKCPHTFFTDCFQRLVECCLIGKKEIVPNCGRACFIDHFKRPVGRLKPDVDAYFGMRIMLAESRPLRRKLVRHPADAG